MAKVTKKHLLERIEALEAEVEALRTAEQPVQLVREVKAPEPLSQPLDVHMLWYNDHVVPGSYPYNPDSESWGINTYL